MKNLTLLFCMLLSAHSVFGQDSPCPTISVEDDGKLLVAAFTTQTSATLVGLTSLSETVKETSLLFRWWSGEQDFPYYFHNREGVPRRASVKDVLFHPETFFDIFCLEYGCAYNSSNLIRIDRQLNDGRDVTFLTHGPIYSSIRKASVTGIEVTWTADNKVASYDSLCFSDLVDGYSTEQILEGAHISSGVDYDYEAYEERKSTVYLGWC
ncbi:MAG: hypothetical protein KDD55_01620, partial [Bdellovibrionales bacterium]|nr:hypothetical protein [Bdellovibrionales bacterium]